MNKKILILSIISILVIIILISLQLSGFLFVDKSIKTPGSNLDWEPIDKDDIKDNSNDSNNSDNDFPLLYNFIKLLEEVPGIENINYEIFVSNETMKIIFNEYKEILENDGYNYHEEYSGEFMYESSRIYYYTFMKGLNGVVIYMTYHNSQTWICYSSGNVLQYQEIFDYMQENDII